MRDRDQDRDRDRHEAKFFIKNRIFQQISAKARFLITRKLNLPTHFKSWKLNQSLKEFQRRSRIGALASESKSNKFLCQAIHKVVNTESETF